YNKLYFELTLPNGATAQLLDVMDYISNNVMMPAIAFFSCILIGWIVTPKWVIDEMELTGDVFRRKKLYYIMVKFVMPVMMAALFLQSTGILGRIFG
ncbi:MAG: sodium-dependent transporter, partial [Eubacterium sp.]|nr:sodium-dependent transporter [Eubacterium sp.]